MAAGRLAVTVCKILIAQSGKKKRKYQVVLVKKEEKRSNNLWVGVRRTHAALPCEAEARYRHTEALI